MSLKYFSNFWKTLEKLLINCEINLTATWSKDCIIFERDRVTTFGKTDGKRYVSVVILSTQDNARLLQQLKSNFKRTFSWNKYQSKATM